MPVNWRKKRLSNLILLSMILLYVLIYVTLIIVTRAGIQWSLGGGYAASRNASDDAGEVLYPYTDFNSLSFDGAWEANVVTGTDYTVMVDMGTSKPKGARVTKNGDSLVLVNPDASRPLTVTIVLPEIAGISAKGATNITLEGFSPESLEIDLDGDSRLTGRNCRAARLKLRAVKNGTADLADTPVGNAEVALSGNSRVYLLLDGGDLTGRVTGKAELLLSGAVANNSVRTVGDGKVTVR